jgi:ribosomal protein S18 acetylase RimI-like enzyme
VPRQTLAGYDGQVIALAELVVDDWARWRELRLQALADAPDAFSSTLTSWQGANEVRWRARLRDVAYNLLAMDGATAVGMISGVAGDPVELISLWVAPAVRGKGVGDALVRAVLAWSGPRATRLNVYPTNAPAIALYRRNGFTEVGLDEGELVMEHR